MWGFSKVRGEKNIAQNTEMSGRKCFQCCHSWCYNLDLEFSWVLNTTSISYSDLQQWAWNFSSVADTKHVNIELHLGGILSIEKHWKGCFCMIVGALKAHLFVFFRKTLSHHFSTQWPHCKGGYFDGGSWKTCSKMVKSLHIILKPLQQ